MLRAWIATVAVIAATSPAFADQVSSRRPHWGLGAGAYLSITGGDDRRTGSVVSAELLFGGRLGVRAEAFGLGQLSPDAFLAGLAYEAAASRPRLQIVLTATAGTTTAADPVGRLGAQTQLWLAGPLAIALDGGALLRVDGSDTELLLEAALVLRLAD